MSFPTEFFFGLVMAIYTGVVSSRLVAYRQLKTQYAVVVYSLPNRLCWDERTLGFVQSCLATVQPIHLAIQMDFLFADKRTLRTAAEGYMSKVAKKWMNEEDAKKYDYHLLEQNDFSFCPNFLPKGTQVDLIDSKLQWLAEIKSMRISKFHLLKPWL